MRIIRQFNIGVGVLLCILNLLASCDRNAHKSEKDGELSVALAWQDADDNGTAINEVCLWIFNAVDSSLVVEEHVDDIRDLSSRRFYLGEGSYKILAAINFVEPFFVGQTARSEVSLAGLLFALSQPSVSPQHAYFGVVDVTISKGTGVCVVTDVLKRILAEMTITITGVPEGAVLTGKVMNAAKGILPCRKNADGEYGVADENLVEVDLPATTAQGTTISTETFRLMPTISGGYASRLYFQLTTPDGMIREYDIEAPVMNIAGKYLINLKYEEMRPYMYLSAVNIKNWTEGWIHKGEILNPQK